MYKSRKPAMISARCTTAIEALEYILAADMLSAEYKRAAKKAIKKIREADRLADQLHIEMG